MNKDNFYKETFADWTLVRGLGVRESFLMKQDFDFVSPSGSAYKYTDEGVYRISNHFTHKVASCNWMLNGAFYNESRQVLAFCKWEDFQSREAMRA